MIYDGQSTTPDNFVTIMSNDVKILLHGVYYITIIIYISVIRCSVYGTGANSLIIDVNINEQMYNSQNARRQFNHFLIHLIYI